jgi:hypothetical protein
VCENENTGNRVLKETLLISLTDPTTFNDNNVEVLLNTNTSLCSIDYNNENILVLNANCTNVNNSDVYLMEVRESMDHINNTINANVSNWRLVVGNCTVNQQKNKWCLSSLGTPLGNVIYGPSFKTFFAEDF